MNLRQTTPTSTVNVSSELALAKSDFSDLIAYDEWYFDPVEELQLLDELGLLNVEEDLQ